MAFLNRFFFFLLLLPFFVVAQNKGTVRVGTSLTAGDDNAPWLSPSEDFAFGFHPLDNDSFLPAIWYNKIKEEATIVWYPINEHNPAVAPRQSKLALTADDGLVLTDPQGRELWKTVLTSNANQVANAVMNDTGNFAVVSENSQTVWESFKHFRDTLLPTQVMEINDQLSSRMGQNNFSIGKFQFRLLQDGNAVLNAIDLQSKQSYNAYYESNTNDSNKSNSGYQVIFHPSGYLYVLRRNGSKFNLTSPNEVTAFPASEYYHKATLNFYGVFTLSYYPKSPSNNASWTTITAEPNDICARIDDLGTNPCGYNSICTLDNQRPFCKCPTGYSPIDPNDMYSGCKPEFSDFCDISSGTAQSIKLQNVQNTDWPTSDYDKFVPLNIEDCKNYCLLDCLCAVVVYNSDERSCWKKKLPLSNGRENSALPTTAFIKLSNSSSTTPRDSPPIYYKKEQSNTVVIVVSALLGSSVFVNFIMMGVVGFGFFLYYKKKYLIRNISYQNESPINGNLRHFTYKELEEATNGFREELGKGSCGIVYKGETDHSGLVAVKMLDRMFQENDQEFQAEVNVIGKTHHKNLVRLVGYCKEKQHRLLVYEYMRNGTLASFLFGQIAYGIARGLVYLHEECSTQIIHCDIKPQNVLLDEYHNARISDFGLAKLLLLNQSHTKTNIRGTKGYVAPDWFRSAPVSVKVDVYSFGVLLLEIICCRKNVLAMDAEAEEKVILTDWAYDCYMDGRIEALIENDMEAMNEIKMVERFLMVALWCLQEDSSVRPTMKKVVLMLEGILQVSPPPSASLSTLMS